MSAKCFWVTLINKQISQQFFNTLPFIALLLREANLWRKSQAHNELLNLCFLNSPKWFKFAKVLNNGHEEICSKNTVLLFKVLPMNYVTKNNWCKKTAKYWVLRKTLYVLTCLTGWRWAVSWVDGSLFGMLWPALLFQSRDYQMLLPCRTTMFILFADRSVKKSRRQTSTLSTVRRACLETLP